MPKHMHVHLRNLLKFDNEMGRLPYVSLTLLSVAPLVFSDISIFQCFDMFSQGKIKIFSCKIWWDVCYIILTVSICIGMLATTIKNYESNNTTIHHYPEKSLPLSKWKTSHQVQPSKRKLQWVTANSVKTKAQSHTVVGSINWQSSVIKLRHIVGNCIQVQKHTYLRQGLTANIKQSGRDSF